MTSSASSAGFDFVDPFGASADPARYVARAATERALERLVRAVRDEHRSAVLDGIPGIGKTLLLRLLARRLAPELRAVHLPYASMPAAALCAWAMDLLGGGTSYDPVGAVVAHARRPHAEGVGLVLLIDDAEAMPEESAPQLARAARESGGALRLVAAVGEGAAGRLAQAWDDAEQVTLSEPMDLGETSYYLAAHLEAAGLPEAARAAFGASTLSELQRRSEGVPGRLNPLASLVLRRVLACAAEQPVEAPAREAAFERAAGRLALAHSELAFEGRGEDDAAAFERAAGRLTLARLEAEPPAEAEPPGRGRLLEDEPRKSEPLIEAEPLESEPLGEAEPLEIEALLEEEPLEVEPLDGEAPGIEGPEEAELRPEAEALDTEPLDAGLAPETERRPDVAGAEAAAEASADSEALRPAPSRAEPRTGEQRAVRTPGARRGLAWGRWLIVFGVCFAIGGGVGIWLGQRRLAEPETPPPASLAGAAAPAALAPAAAPAALAPAAAPAALAPAPAAPSPSTTGVAPGAPSVAEEKAAAPEVGEQAPPAAEMGEQSVSAVSPAVPAAAVSVQINANPWATILVDGEEVGITPLAGVPVGAGPHRFEARFPDGSVVERVVEIDQVNRFVVFP